jgi:hypothetical protein
MLSDTDKDLILLEVKRWLEAVVIGLNLCPFAGSVYRAGKLNIEFLETPDTTACLHSLVDAADMLRRSDPQSSTLLVLTDGFKVFDDYLDLLAIAEDLLSASGFDGIVQLASFHPHYCFEGCKPEDPGNWTNRSPYPMLHLLTETSVARAVDEHPEPTAIPANNMKKLEKLGADTIRQLMLGHK